MSEQTKLKFSVKKTIAAPQFFLVVNKPFYFTAMSPITFTEKKEGQDDDKGVIPKMTVEDLETGKTGTLLLTELTLSALRENYPDDGHVGKSFRLIKMAKPSGRSYNPIEFDEIEVTV